MLSVTIEKELIELAVGASGVVGHNEAAGLAKAVLRASATNARIYNVQHFERDFIRLREIVVDDEQLTAGPRLCARHSTVRQSRCWLNKFPPEIKAMVSGQQ